MAWVILLGLASVTQVDLFVLPVGCAMFLKQIPSSESECEVKAPKDSTSSVLIGPFAGTDSNLSNS